MNTVRNTWRNQVRVGVVCIALLVAGCGGLSWNPLKPYRIDIQQGNAVTQKMVAKLKPGMTRAQVRFALGTPLVVDPFRSDRWDYVYYLEKPGEAREYRHIVVVFKGERLERLEGDVVPSGAEGKGALSIDKPVAAPGAASAASKTESAATAPSVKKDAPLVKKDAPTTEEPSPTNDKPADSAPAQDGGFFGGTSSPLGF